MWQDSTIESIPTVHIQSLTVQLGTYEWFYTPTTKFLKTSKSIFLEVDGKVDWGMAMVQGKEGFMVMGISAGRKNVNISLEDSKCV